MLRLVRQRRFDNDVFQDGEGLLLVRIATLYAVAGDGGEVVRDRRVIFSGFSVAQDADLVVFIAADGIGLLFHGDLDALAQQIDLFDCAAPVGGVDKGFLLGAVLDEVLIGVLLIF